MFNDAKWITQGKFVDEIAPMMRKEISIEKEVKKATMNIIALGYGIYAIDDVELTEDVLSTQFTTFDKRVLYNKYDVTHLLKKGKHCISIIIGNGCYNQMGKTAWTFERATWRDTPKAAMELLVEYENGETEKLVTDTSWKSTLEGPIIYNHVRCGEIYDARKEIDGWRKVGFDDSKWVNVSLATPPTDVLEENVYPNPKIIRTIEAVLKNDKNVYDFGENLSGWACVEVEGERGAVVHIRYGERLYDDGSLDNQNEVSLCKPENRLRHEDVYILKGEGVETYHPVFNYHGFRYVSVETEGKVTIHRALAHVVHTDLKIVGEFECSDDMLNKIHEATRRATLTNFLSIPTDCPHREQNGWTGDAQLSAQQSLMNYDMVLPYRKWLSDIRDAQRVSGQIPSIVPTANHWGLAATGSGPAWDSALVLIPWQTYEYTDNKEILRENIDSIKKYMEFLGKMSDGYIVSHGLGDWCPPTDVELCPISLTSTAYYYADAITTAKICDKLGVCGGTEYRELAAKIRKAFRAEFIQDETIGNGGQTAYACAIYFDLLDDDEKKRAAQKLAQMVIDEDYHIKCGILGTKFIFKALAEYGYSDVLYKAVTNPTCPSYAYWILNGMTTLCEHWEMKSSLNHHMFSEVDHWLYRYVAGIRLGRYGLEIKPHFIGLSHVKANHKGIEVEYDRKKIRIKSPVEFDLLLNGEKQHFKSGEHSVIL